jgi:ABC-2 type transport system ATP-binding protein
MSVIEINHLAKHFGDVRAVDGLSFAIEAGTVAGFLGPNGSGKTTTLRTLVGLVAPTAGGATINGRPYRDLRDPLREVGALLEASAAHPARTARNHLRVLAAEARVPRSRVDELLELVDLGAAADRRAGGFSLGMKQRLGLAGALVGDPQILILDEPANGLDPEGMRWLRDFLRSFASQGRTVLLSSHVLSEIAQTVDEVVVINSGRLVVHSPLSELIEQRGEHRVRVRSSQPAVLAEALHIAGMPNSTDGTTLTIDGGSQDVIAQIAFDHGVVVYEITGESSTLEEAFLVLTAEPAEEVRP